MRIQGQLSVLMLDADYGPTTPRNEVHALSFTEDIDHFPATSGVLEGTPVGEACILHHQYLREDNGVITLVLHFTGPNTPMATSDAKVDAEYAMTFADYHGRRILATIQRLSIVHSKEDMRVLGAAFARLGDGLAH